MVRVPPGFRYFITVDKKGVETGEPVPVDTEGSCINQHPEWIRGRQWHLYFQGEGPERTQYAVRCPASLTEEQKQRLRRALGG